MLSCNYEIILPKYNHRNMGLLRNNPWCNCLCPFIPCIIMGISIYPSILINNPLSNKMECLKDTVESISQRFFDKNIMRQYKDHYLLVSYLLQLWDFHNLIFHRYFIYNDCVMGYFPYLTQHLNSNITHIIQGILHSNLITCL